MRHHRPFTVAALAVVVGSVALSACSDSEPEAEEASAEEPVPVASVTAPASRQTPFCEAMIDLSDSLRAGDEPDVEAAIIETYRAVEDEVPEVIEADFEIVLAALEAGEPVPTDPPRDTIETIAPTSIAEVAPTTELAAPAGTAPDATTPSDSGPTSTTPDSGTVAADVANAPADSPSERINNYVDFACRSTANNPGPPATQPLEEPTDG